MVCIHCPLCCMKHFPTVGDLKNHLLLYAEGSMKCPVCNHYSSGLNNLILHLDKHSDSRRRQTSGEAQKLLHQGQMIEGVRSSSLVILDADDKENKTEYVQDEDYDQGLDNVYPETYSAADNGEAEISGSCYTCGMCEVMFDSMDLLNEHAAELHGISSLLVIDDFSEISTPIVVEPTSRPSNEIERGDHEDDDNDAVQLLHEVESYLPDTQQPGHSVNKLQGIENNLQEMQLEPSNSRKAGLSVRLSATAFRCDVCDKTFNFAKRLEEHKYTHMERSKWPLVCPKCKNRFIHKQNLRRHILHVHIDLIPREFRDAGICVRCNEPYSSLKHLLNYFKDGEKALSICGLNSLELMKKYTCDVCGIDFNDQIKLEIHHYRSHVETSEWPYECPCCLKRMIFKHNLIKHLKVLHLIEVSEGTEDTEGTIKCTVCEEVFESIELTQEHIESSHKNLSKCKCCYSFFCSDQELNQHVKEIHDTVKKFSCNICGKRFVKRTSYENHISIHNQRHKCNICDETFCNLDYLTRHMKVVHGIAEREKFICEICGKMFKAINLLTIHVRRHTGERPFICPTCNKGFLSKGGLRVHMTIHTEREKIHPCRFCTKSFVGKVHLFSHERLHTRPFKCEICKLPCDSRRRLRKHMRTHQKDYNCRKCGLEFTSLFKLEGHERCCNYDSEQAQATKVILEETKGTESPTIVEAADSIPIESFEVVEYSEI